MYIQDIIRALTRYIVVARGISSLGYPCDGWDHAHHSWQHVSDNSAAPADETKVRSKIVNNRATAAAPVGMTGQSGLQYYLQKKRIQIIRWLSKNCKQAVLGIGQARIRY